jgi:SAM-dependent methyltransferase
MIRDEAPHWDEFRDTAIGRQLLRREQAFLQASLDAQARSARVLELCACGGRVSLPLRDQMSSLVAADIDHDALKLFRRRSGLLPAVTADAASLPFARGSFDCVVAIQCLRYFDLGRFLHDCHRVLSDDGLLVIQAVNRKGYKRRAKELIRPARRRADTGTISTRALLRSMTQAGFDVERVEGYNWIPMFADFGRLDNSGLVEPAAQLESALGLHRYHHVSPWVLVAARKRSRSLDASR